MVSSRHRPVPCRKCPSQAMSWPLGKSASATWRQSLSFALLMRQLRLCEVSSEAQTLALSDSSRVTLNTRSEIRVSGEGVGEVSSEAVGEVSREISGEVWPDVW